MTAAELKAIADRVNAATPGPWMAWSDEGGWYSLCRASGYEPDPEVPHVCLGRFSYGSPDGPLPGYENAALAAHARTDVPALLQYIAELEQALTGRTVSCSRCEELARVERVGGGE